jgi:hypothetical protein
VEREPPLYVRNEVEANLLEALMRSEEVPGFVRAYRDPDYHGAWTFNDAYGQVECPGEFHARVAELLEAIRRR